MPGLDPLHFGQVQACPLQRQTVMKIGSAEIRKNVVLEIWLDSSDSIQDSKNGASLGAFSLQKIRCVLRAAIWIEVLIPYRSDGVPDLDGTKNRQKRTH